MADLINGLFEAVTGICVVLNCLRLYRDKEVKGVVWQLTFFYMSWGVFNLYFYPSLGQWLSFSGGCVIVLANTVWVVMAIKYRRKK